MGAIIAVVIIGWAVLSVGTALGLGKASKIRDQKEKIK